MVVLTCSLPIGSESRSAFGSHAHLADRGILELIVEHGPEACMAKDFKQRTPLSWLWRRRTTALQDSASYAKHFIHISKSLSIL